MDGSPELSRTELMQRNKSIIASKLESWDDVFGSVRHQVNNPLAIIRLQASHLARMSNPSEVDLQRASQELITQIQRINQYFTSFQKIARNAFDDERKDCNMNALVKEAVNLLLHSANYRQVDVQVKCDDSKLYCHIAESQILQVCYNLVQNAINVAGRSEEKLVRVVSSVRDSKLQIQVQNSGKKVPADLCEKLFDPFFTSRNVMHSLGLGLSIAREILREHGGELSVDASAPQTAFVLTLPLLSR